MHLAYAVIFTSLALGAAACGDDGDDADTTAADTHVAGDTAATTDTTSEEDTGVATTTEADTSVATDAEVTQSTCGCGTDALCLQAKTAQGCATLGPSCTSPQQLVDACSTDAVMASCERNSTILYHYFERIEDWVADLAETCASTLTGPAGTLTVTTVPAGVGAVCSCQRTAASCVQVYGDTCTGFACEAGLQATECAAENRVPGRCVTQDGQRELFFYTPGANLENAELSCLGASATDYYWFPAL